MAVNVKAPYSVKEAAALLNVSRQQIRSMIHNNELYAVKVGREYRIPQQSLSGFLSLKNWKQKKVTYT